MNTACMAQETSDPLSMLMRVLDKIMSESVSPRAKARERALPIKGFTEAPSRLRKMGISLLVTLEDDETLKEIVVPLRVDEDTLMAGSMSYTHEKRSSWKGRQIHPISRRFFDSFDLVLRKVKDCLKVAWHRFTRKINPGAKHARHRAQRGQERHYRFEHARICCH